MIFTKKTLIRLLSLMLCGVLLLGCVMACDQGEDPAETETGTQQATTEEESTSLSETESESESESDTEAVTDETSTEEGTTPEEEPDDIVSDFSVGYAITDFTPNSLSGYSFTNNASSPNYKVVHPLYATCVAVKSGEDTALLFNVDVIRLETPYIQIVQTKLSELTGIPKENILINVSHTHSVPNPSGDVPASVAWRTISLAKFSNLATQALADLETAEAYIGSTRLKNMNFVRRYVLADGTHEMNPATGKKPVAHESDADNELQMILFKRQEKKPVVMVNWRAHPCITDKGLTIISGDYVSTFRAYMEAQGYLFAFWQGASGNVNTFSLLAGESTQNHYKNVMWYGEELAKAVLQTIPSLTKAETRGLYANACTITMTVNHATDPLVSKATEISLLFDDPTKEKEAKELCVKYGISSKLAAYAILERSRKGKTEEVTVYALSFGDIAFATAPFELFSVTGVYMKENSPCKMTFASGYTNGKQGYLPNEEVFPYGSYEVDVCLYVSGTAEIVADTLLDALNKQAELRNASLS